MTKAAQGYKPRPEGWCATIQTWLRPRMRQGLPHLKTACGGAARPAGSGRASIPCEAGTHRKDEATAKPEKESRTSQGGEDVKQPGGHWRRRHGFSTLALLVAAFVLATMALLPSSAWAGRLDNAYDGNIFALYAGDGAMTPPRNSLADSLRRHRPTVLVFYLDDCSDCKRFAPTLSRLNGEFRTMADVIALSTDSLGSPEDASPDDPSRYWRGLVPQVVILDRHGDVVLDRTGQIPLEDLEQSLSAAAGLELPEAMARRRTQAMEVNEINAEVVRAP